MSKLEINDELLGLDKDGAEKLATKIMLYWATKGHAVKTWIEPVPRRFGQYQVRSDLTNGAPSAKS
jgi:hypothetical protein